MTIVIDRAGRIVVPKSPRERFNVVTGTELETEVTGDSLRLRKAHAEPPLVRKRGVLVHRGDARRSLDVGAFIRAERESRSRRISGGGASDV